MLDNRSLSLSNVVLSCLFQSTLLHQASQQIQQTIPGIRHHSPGGHPVTQRGSKPWAKKERHQGTYRKPQPNSKAPQGWDLGIRMIHYDHAPKDRNPTSWRTATLFFASIPWVSGQSKKVNSNRHMNHIEISDCLLITAISVISYSICLPVACRS